MLPGGLGASPAGWGGLIAGSVVIGRAWSSHTVSANSAHSTSAGPPTIASAPSASRATVAACSAVRQGARCKCSGTVSRGAAAPVPVLVAFRPMRRSTSASDCRSTR